MRIWVDASYYAYFYGYHADNTNPYEFVENIIGPNVFIAVDSKNSIRKNSIPWYKANRVDLEHNYIPTMSGPTCYVDCKACKQEAYKKRVDNIIDELWERYRSNCVCEDGYEADDIIAQHVLPNDTVFINDKDYLTIPTRAKLLTLKMEPVTVDRFKAPHLPLSRGNRALAYQLLHGDVADNIPRLLKRNKQAAIDIFNSDNPLKAAIDFVGEEQAIGSLCALALPTPLLSCENDVITCVLERYKP